MRATTIWVLEDDPVCWEITRETLEPQWSVLGFPSIASFELALRERGDQRIDLVVADICLSDANFVSWVASGKTRELLPDVPFLVVSSIDEPETIRAAFRGGAVDFLSKPFGRAALVVKVERALALAHAPRTPVPAPPLGSSESLEIDASRMALRAGETTVDVTAKEMRIVSLLWSAPERTLTRDDLRAGLWSDTHVGRKTLDVHLSRLRRKLAPLHVDLRSLPSDRVALVLGASDRAT